MSNDPYYILRVADLPAEEEDLVSGLLFSNGAQGVSQTLEFQQPNLTYEPEVKASELVTLESYFEQSPAPELLATLQAAFPASRFSVESQENKDWLESWKAGFEPFHLTGPFWVVPSWRPVPAEAETPLFIDPGMAFGTGTHETTRIAAKLMVEAFDQEKSSSLLDVGTGTGILAMIACKAGVDTIEAIDIDPESERVANENFARNDCAAIRASTTSLDKIQNTFQMVVANIIDGVLIRIGSDLKKSLAPNGILILSGILKENQGEVEANLIRRHGFQIERVSEEDMWMGYRLRGS